MRPWNELEKKIFLKCARGESISFGDRAWDRAKTHLKKLGHIEFDRASHSWKLTDRGTNVYEIYYK